MKHIVLAVLWCVCSITGSCKSESNVLHATDIVGDILGESEIFPRLPIVALSSSNEQCRDDSRLLLDNLQNATTWAVQMLESSARRAVGALKGRIYQLGDYDECVETVTPIQGRYCLVTVTVSRLGASLAADSSDHFYDPYTSAWDKINNVGAPSKIPRNVIYWALCVPASCSPEDVQASIDLHLAATSRNTSDVSVRVTVDAELCRINVAPAFSIETTAFCCLLLGLILLVSSSTVLSYFYVKQESDIKGGNDNKDFPATEYFLCFALQRNISDFVATASTHDSLLFIDGIKVISMCAVIAGHRLGSLQGFSIQNFETIERNVNTVHSTLLYQSDLAVDTFFVLSGLIVVFILIPRKTFNSVSMIILRYIRLTPPYMLAVFFCSTLMYKMGDGPLWHSVIGTERDACRENWWTNLLYISNYVHEDKMCMVHSWYLPCDMHFFILALLAIKMLQKYPKVGCVVLGFATTLSIVIPFTITYIGHKAPLLYFFRDFLVSSRTHDVFLTMYIKSHNRASAYAVGIATGYFLSTTNDSKNTFEVQYKRRSSLGMLLGCCICLAALIPGSMLYSPTWRYDVMEASLAAGLRRFTWSVGVSLFVIGLHFNKKSTIGSFLSSPLMIVLGKLTYSTYLVHMIIQTMHVATARTPLHLSVLSYIHLVLGDIALSLGVALVLYLTVEAPVRHLCRLVVTKQKTIPSLAPPTFNYIVRLENDDKVM